MAKYSSVAQLDIYQHALDPQLEVTLPALGLESDYWLCIRRKHFKIVTGVWLLEIIGPPPHLGEWVAGNEKNHWEWRPTDRNHPLLKGEEGTWFFEGRQPTFKINHWLFVSEHPRLFFRHHDGTLHSKLFIKDYSLCVRRDSLGRLQRLKELIFALHTEYRFRQLTKTSLKQRQQQEHESLKQLQELNRELQLSSPEDWRLLTQRDQEPNQSDRSGSNEKLPFAPIGGPAERKVMMNEFVREKVAMTLWTPGQKYVLNTTVEEKVSGSKLVIYHLNCQPQEQLDLLIEEIKNKSITTLYCKGVLASGCVFFCLRPAHEYLCGRALVGQLPSEMWTLQRRTALRYHYPLAQLPDVTIEWGNGRSVLGRLHNLSSSGSCLILAHEEYIPQIEANATIPQVTLNLEIGTFKTSATIRWKGPLAQQEKQFLSTGNPQSTIKFGIQFNSLPESIAEVLNRYVLEKSAQSSANPSPHS